MSEAAHNEAMEATNHVRPAMVHRPIADELAEAVRLHVRCFPLMVGSGPLRTALKAYDAATMRTEAAAES
jgi:predicted ATPase